jgi:hypothetical protein
MLYKRGEVSWYELVLNGERIRESTKVGNRREFYKAKLKTLVADQALASRRIDAIDEAVVERYLQSRCLVKSHRKRVLAPGSINRELATLRRLHGRRFLGCLAFACCAGNEIENFVLSSVLHMTGTGTRISPHVGLH